MTDTAVPTDQLRAFADSSGRVVATLGTSSRRLAGALARVQATTEPAWKPPIDGGPGDIDRWRDVHGQVDNWVDRVAEVYDLLDDPSWLTEWVLLPMTGVPDLPAGWAGLFDLLDAVTPDPVAAFEAVREELAAQPALVAPWLAALPTSQLETLFEARWAQLLALDGLSDDQVDALHEQATSNLPRVRDWETVGTELGWGFLTVGTEMGIETVVEYDDDVYVTLRLTDELAAGLESPPVDVEVAAGFASTITLRFDDVDHLEEVMDEIGAVLDPGLADVGFGWSMFAFGPMWPAEPAALTAAELARQLDRHADLVVADVDTAALTAAADVLHGLFAAGAVASVSVDRTTGDTIVTSQATTSTTPTATLPADVRLGAGEATLETTESVRLAADGTPLARTTTTTTTVAAGAITVGTDAAGLTLGTDTGQQVIHTRTVTSDGVATEILVVTDTTVDRSGLRLDVGGAGVPSIELAHEDGTAVTAEVYLRDPNDGTWTRVDP